jgi:protein O-GlcNAc transferase
VDTATASLIRDAAALRRQGALAEAAERYRQALRAEPDNADTLHALAQVSCELGRLDEGIAYARGALAADTKRARTHVLLGMALARTARTEEALACFERAIACEGTLAEAHGNRADVLAALGRQAEAVASYDVALELEPDSTENWCNRGAALHDLKRFDEAIASYDRVLALKPDFAEVHFNRGNALALSGRHDDALAAYDKALAITPGYLDAMLARASALFKLERHDEAIACYEEVVRIDPHYRGAVAELAHSCLWTCDWDRLGRLTALLHDVITDHRSIISPFILIGLSVGAAARLECTRRFVEHEVPRLPIAQHKRAARRSGPIRIAYLSADFREHATAYLAAGLFERHDRARFEIVGISFGLDDKSDMRARLGRSFDRFHDVTTQSNRDVAQLLADLGVDIAVDLKGHTEGARPGILAARPAPIQVSFLGYPGSMGAGFIDYVIADRIVLPFDQQPVFAEKIVHLPDSYQVNDSGREIAPRALQRRETGLPERAFVFCCFNHSWKITPEMFDIWMRLLRAVEGSVLWLFQSNERARANLRREAAARGIDPARLVFAPLRDQPDHLARLRHADLFLDTLPCNAHTTASDALWAGVPVVTCMGETFAGRVAASLLHAVGLPELAAASLGDYEALARKLATNPALLAATRARLERNRLTQPLFDTDRFRRHIEAAYMTMWETWQRGQAPRSFAVEPIGA